MGKDKCLDKAKMGMRNTTKGDISASDLEVAGKLQPCHPTPSRPEKFKRVRPASAYSFR